MSNQGYQDRQREQNSAYSQAYADWVASLPPKKLRQLEAQGLLDPQVDPFHIGKASDISELPISADEVVPEMGDADENEQVWAALRLVIAELLADPNPGLALDCLALVSGIGFMGESMTRIAKRHCVTRAAVSKRCVQLTQQLQMMPSRAMRSLTARQSYRNAQHKHHEHRERFDHRRPCNNH